MSTISNFQTENVLLEDLKPHPKNYREHPEDQIEHLIQSIKEHGLYRNVVIAKDGTILAGHGVVKAVTKMGMDSIPVIRMNVAPNSPAALKVLAGDNEIGRLGEVDDRMFTEILKEIRDTDVTGLLGTGFDDMMLADLLKVTDEISFPELASGDKQPFQQMTFTLHDQQAEQVKRAIYAAKMMGSSTDSPNENSNGNALAQICESFLTEHGDR